jgi:hypothetical protein
MSSTAGETLREEGAVRNEEVADAVWACWRMLDALVLGLWLVEGRRGSASVWGVADRLVVAEERLVVGWTFIDMRWAASAFRSWPMGKSGRPASEADRCWRTGASTGDCSSTTLGRPTQAYEIVTAMSQLRPLSHREMDMVRAFAASCTTASS